MPSAHPPNPHPCRGGAAGVLLPVDLPAVLKTRKNAVEVGVRGDEKALPYLHPVEDPILHDGVDRYVLLNFECQLFHLFCSPFLCRYLGMRSSQIRRRKGETTQNRQLNGIKITSRFASINRRSWAAATVPAGFRQHSGFCGHIGIVLCGRVSLDAY